MKTFVDELKGYFETTSREKVLADWAKYDTDENNVGPTVNEFLDNCDYYNFTSLYTIDSGTFEIENKNLSPEFSSGFLLPIFDCKYVNKIYL